MYMVPQGTKDLLIQLAIEHPNGQVHDPSGATVRKMTFTFPDRTKIEKLSTDVSVAVMTEDDGTEIPCLQCLLEVRLIQVGTHYVQGYFEDQSGSWPVYPVTFEVFRSLDDFTEEDA